MGSAGTFGQQRERSGHSPAACGGAPQRGERRRQGGSAALDLFQDRARREDEDACVPEEASSGQIALGARPVGLFDETGDAMKAREVAPGFASEANVAGRSRAGGSTPNDQRPAAAAGAAAHWRRRPLHRAYGGPPRHHEHRVGVGEAICAAQPIAGESQGARPARSFASPAARIAAHARRRTQPDVAPHKRRARDRLASSEGRRHATGVSWRRRR
jgi:hypothetical protein